MHDLPLGNFVISVKGILMIGVLTDASSMSLVTASKIAAWAASVGFHQLGLTNKEWQGVQVQRHKPPGQAKQHQMASAANNFKHSSPANGVKKTSRQHL